jgi:hypothetical protein
VDEQLKTLFDYTKFHIGIYITIGTALVAALAFDQTNNVHFSLGHCARIGFQIALGLQGLAGLGGGIICTHLIRYTTFKAFSEKQTIGFGLSFCFWEKFEHYSFWLSIAIAAVCGAFLIPAVHV